MFTIDAHVHFGHDRQDRNSVGLLSVGSREALDHIRSNNLDKALLIPFNEVEFRLKTSFFGVNMRLKEFIEGYPGSFIGCARLNPHDLVNELRSEIQDSSKWARMYKIHTRSQGVALDSVEMERTLQILTKLNQQADYPLLIHSEVRKNPKYFEMWHSVAGMYPNIPFIIAHFGSTYFIKDLTNDVLGGFKWLLDRHKNIFCDISVCGIGVVEKVLEVLPSDRLIWGSDFCYRDEQEIAQILALIRKSDYANDLLGRSFLKVLNMKGHNKSIRGHKEPETVSCLTIKPDRKNPPNSAFDLLAFRLRKMILLSSAMPIIPSKLYFVKENINNYDQVNPSIFQSFKHWVAKAYLCGKNKPKLYGSLIYDMVENVFHLLSGYNILEMGTMDGGIIGTEFKYKDRLINQKNLPEDGGEVYGAEIEIVKG
jgi:predicted TIM-barrel fold metal-dependent hydrolase